MYYTNKLKGKPLQMMGYKVTGSKRCKPQDTYGAKFGSKSGGHAVLAVGYVETTKYQYLRIADGWNDYLRYINFNGYDYTRKDGWSFSVSK